jgi:hypothetical protein
VKTRRADSSAKISRGGKNLSRFVPEFMQRWAEKIKDLYDRIIFKLTGDDEVMRRMWSAAGTGDSSEHIIKAKLRNKNTIIIIAAGLAVSLALCLLSLRPPELPDTTRNPYGGSTKKFDAEVTAEYGSEKIKKKVSIGVLAAEANAAEIAEKLENLKARLPNIILGDNESLRDIRYDLNLIDIDPESGAAIMWSSDKESAVTAEGKVNHIEGKTGERIGLRANIRLGEASDSSYIDVTMGDPPANYDFTGDMERSVFAATSEVSSENSGGKAALPEQTEGGVKLTWKPISDNTAFFTPLIFIVLGVIAYRRRYAGAGREIAAARESVERDFPDFLDKLLLLLNAGVVISSAMSKIADDYRERAELITPAHEIEKPRRVFAKPVLPEKLLRKIGFRGSDASDSGENSRKSEPVIIPENSGGSYFYEELCRMENRIQSSHVSLISEFSELAVKSGRREVMRFSAILADNIDKGNALGEKLTQESGALWDMRKKNAEKKGRIAETKLTFPMVLQLIAIILITIAPATIEMR